MIARLARLARIYGVPVDALSIGCDCQRLMHAAHLDTLNQHHELFARDWRHLKRRKREWPET